MFVFQMSDEKDTSAYSSSFSFSSSREERGSSCSSRSDVTSSATSSDGSYISDHSTESYSSPNSDSPINDVSSNASLCAIYVSEESGDSFAGNSDSDCCSDSDDSDVVESGTDREHEDSQRSESISTSSEIYIHCENEDSRISVEEQQFSHLGEVNSTDITIINDAGDSSEHCDNVSNPNDLHESHLNNSEQFEAINDNDLLPRISGAVINNSSNFERLEEIEIINNKLYPNDDSEYASEIVIISESLIQENKNIKSKNSKQNTHHDDSLSQQIMDNDINATKIEIESEIENSRINLQNKLVNTRKDEKLNENEKEEELKSISVVDIEEQFVVDAIENQQAKRNSIKEDKIIANTLLSCEGYNNVDDRSGDVSDDMGMVSKLNCDFVTQSNIIPLSTPSPETVDVHVFSCADLQSDQCDEEDKEEENVEVEEGVCIAEKRPSPTKESAASQYCSPRRLLQTGPRPESSSPQGYAFGRPGGDACSSGDARPSGDARNVELAPAARTTARQNNRNRRRLECADLMRRQRQLRSNLADLKHSIVQADRWLAETLRRSTCYRDACDDGLARRDADLATYRAGGDRDDVTVSEVGYDVTGGSTLRRSRYIPLNYGLVKAGHSTTRNIGCGLSKSGSVQTTRYVINKSYY